MPQHEDGSAMYLAEFDLLLQQLRDCHVQQVLHSRACEAKTDSEVGAPDPLQLLMSVGKDSEAEQVLETVLSEEQHEAAMPASALQQAEAALINQALAEGADLACGSAACQSAGDSAMEAVLYPKQAGSPLSRILARLRGGDKEDQRELQEVGRFQNALQELSSLRSAPTARPRNCLHCVVSGFKPCKRIVTMPAVQCLFGGLLVLNTVLLALNVQVSGWDRGVDESFVMTTGVQRYSDREPWRWLLRASQTLETVIGFAFVLELLGKLLGLGLRKFAKDPWNHLDLVVVTAWLLEVLTHTMRLGGILALRALRVLRAFRVVRLLKTVEAFDSLFLLNAALRGCAAVLFWSLLYFVLVQITLALAISQYLHEFYLADKSIPHADREEVYQYFGTFSYATLTMFEMTLANWPPVCRVMMHRLSQWWVIFALFHKLTIGFAIVGIINGAVMQETFKAAARDQDVMVRDKRKQVQEIRRSLQLVFESLDRRHKGNLDLAQFTKVCAHPVLRLWLNSIGLNTEDAEKLFKLIDDGDGLISAEEFLSGIERLRGVASSIDLHVSLRDVVKRLTHGSKSQGEFLHALEARITEQSTHLNTLAKGVQLDSSSAALLLAQHKATSRAAAESATPSHAAPPPKEASPTPPQTRATPRIFQAV